jgi:selenoprotein W-related protein
VIRQEFGIKPELIEGRGGVFDVTVDGKTIFSKRSAGRFPQEDEIVSAVRALGR